MEPGRAYPWGQICVGEEGLEGTLEEALTRLLGFHGKQRCLAVGGMHLFSE